MEILLTKTLTFMVAIVFLLVHTHGHNILFNVYVWPVLFSCSPLMYWSTRSDKSSYPKRDNAVSWWQCFTRLIITLGELQFITKWDLFCVKFVNPLLIEKNGWRTIFQDAWLMKSKPVESKNTVIILRRRYGFFLTSFVNKSQEIHRSGFKFFI